MKLVKYIGNKVSKTDNVAATGLIWGPGQVHPVLDDVAAKLFSHPTVWKDVTHEEGQAQAETDAASVLKRPVR